MGHTKASQLCTQFCAKMTTCVNASQYPYYISVTTDHRSTAVIMVAATTYSATSETLLISRRMARSSTTTTRAITTEYWWHSSAIFKFKIVLGTASVVTFVPLLDIIVADMVEWKWWRDRPRCHEWSRSWSGLSIVSDLQLGRNKMWKVKDTQHCHCQDIFNFTSSQQFYCLNPVCSIWK